jgi:hypothetical protein
MGFKAQVIRIFQFEQGPAGMGEVTHIGELACDDTAKRGDDAGVIEHGFGLSDSGMGNGVTGLELIEFGAGDGLLVKQRLEPGQVLRGLVTQGDGLLKAGLGFAGIEFHEQIARLHDISRNGVETFDPATEPGFDGRTQFGADCAHDFLAGVMGSGIDAGDANGGGGQGLGPWRGFVTGAGSEGRQNEEGNGEDKCVGDMCGPVVAGGAWR